MMERELVTITLLLLSVTCSSSLDPTITTIDNRIVEDFTTIGPLSVVTSRDDTTSDKVIGEAKTSTAKRPTFHVSTKEPEVTSEQEKRATGEATAEEATTSINKKPSPATFRPRPVIDLVSHSTDLPVTSPEVTNTVGQESTTSHPNYTMVGTTKPTDSKKVPNPYPPTPKPKDVRPAILIAVCMVILILIMITVIIVMVRNKRRSRSQSFHIQSRSSKRENAWAGQVPDLGDGKITERPVGMENGAAGNKPEKEQEMVTFISNEKKNESVEEVNETNNGDTLEEQKPLLEDGPQEKEEMTPAPNVEQELV